MIWNPEYECMDRAALHQLQLRRLQMTASWAYERVPHYRARMEEGGVRPRDIRALDDLRRLPFTDESALRDAFPFGMFALPLDEVVRVHSSSGTTGKPVVVGYSRGDINTWTELTSRVAAAAGVQRGDLVQMAFPYGMSTGAWGLHYGIERIGATIIPAGAGQSERHLVMMRDFGTTVLVATPSYALFLVEQAEELGVDLGALKLRLGLFGGEPCPDSMKDEIEARLDIRATDNYGLSEVMGPGVAGECECACGLHVNEDHLLLEIVDPASGEPLPHGEEGELVITTLTKEAFPLLRYRTHDLTTLGPVALRVRPHAGAYGEGEEADRRHAHRPGRQRLPRPDRGRPLQDRGRAAALPGRRRPEEAASTTSRCGSRSMRTSSRTSWATSRASRRRWPASSSRPSACGPASRWSNPAPSPGRPARGSGCWTCAPGADAAGTRTATRRRGGGRRRGRRR